MDFKWSGVVGILAAAVTDRGETVEHHVPWCRAGGDRLHMRRVDPAVERGEAASTATSEE